MGLCHTNVRKTVLAVEEQKEDKTINIRGLTGVGVLWRSYFHLLQWVFPISVAQNILNGKYFSRIALFPVSSPLLHFPPVDSGSLHQMPSLLACYSTWKSWFLEAPQKSLLPAIKRLKLIYHFLWFDAHQIWSSLHLLWSSSHHLQSHQHSVTKDSIRLTPGVPGSCHTQISHKREHALGHCGSRHHHCNAEQRCKSLIGPLLHAGTHPRGLQATATRNAVPLQMLHHRHGRGQEQHYSKTEHLKWSCSRQQETVLRHQSDRNLLPGTWRHFKQDVTANHTTWTLWEILAFQVLEIWKSLATLKQKSRAKGTLPMRATRRYRRGDPEIMTKSLLQVFFSPLAASSLCLVCFVLDMAVVPGYFTTLLNPTWAWGGQMPQLYHCPTPGRMLLLPELATLRLCYSSPEKRNACTTTDSDILFPGENAISTARACVPALCVITSHALSFSYASRVTKLNFSSVPRTANSFPWVEVSPLTLDSSLLLSWR